MGVSDSVGSEQFADVGGEFLSRTILAASEISVDLLDVSSSMSRMGPQSEAVGEVSDELMGAYHRVSQAATAENQDVYSPCAPTS